MRQNLIEFVGQVHRQMILQFGPPKTGKTRNLYTLWKMGKRRFRIFDFDRGADPFINLLMKEKDVNPNDIVICQYIPKLGDKVGDTQARPRGQGRELFLDFLKDWNELQDKVDITTGQWKPAFQPQAPEVIVLDSLTVLQDIILDFVLAMVGHNLNDPGTDGRSDYGMQMAKLEEIVESAKCLPAIVIMNAHESLDKNEITSETRIDPKITGKLAPHFAKSFGISVYTTTKKAKVGDVTKTEYLWLTKPDGYVKGTGLRTKEGLPDLIPQDYSLIL